MKKQPPKFNNMYGYINKIRGSEPRPTNKGKKGGRDTLANKIIGAGKNPLIEQYLQGVVSIVEEPPSEDITLIKKGPAIINIDKEKTKEIIGDALNLTNNLKLGRSIGAHLTLENVRFESLKRGQDSITQEELEYIYLAIAVATDRVIKGNKEKGGTGPSYKKLLENFKKKYEEYFPTTTKEHLSSLGLK